MKRLLAALAVLGSLGTPAIAQVSSKTPQPGFNLFSVSQDIEIGRQSAVEAERQLVLLNSPSVDRYLNRIVQRLAAQAPGAKYPYQIKTVNAAEINAFALPGGPMYVNRGLLEAARSEAELAGVLAHELSHVALRHGTHQASKAYLSQAGLGLLGGLIGRQSSATKVLNTVGGVGLNAVFLKFSRDDEYEADQTGASMMAKAGYDPVAMANFFEQLRVEQGRSPGKLEQFFSSHPPPADREARIRQQASQLGAGKAQVLGGFANLQASLRSLGSAPRQVAEATDYLGPDTTATGRAEVRVAAPSSRLVRFAQPSGFFSIDHPVNWTAYASGLAVSIAPEGGVITRADGRQVLLYGVIINHYAPFEGQETRRSRSLERSYAPFEDRNAPRGALEDATDDLVRTILYANAYLRAEPGPAREERIDGAPGFSVRLSGLSPVTGEVEQVTLYARGVPDGHVIYAMAVAPARESSVVDNVFARMLRSLQVSEAAAHWPR